MRHDDDMNLGYDEDEGFLPDTTDVPDGGDFDVLPAGLYVVEVEKTERAKSRAGDPMLKLQLNVVEGEFEGRKLFDQIVFRHSNPKAEKIGLQRLKMLKVAVGKPDLRAEHDLWNVPILAKVKIRKDTSEDQRFGDQNNITAYKPVDEQAAAAAPKPSRSAAPSQQRQPAPDANPAKATTPPWSRK